MACADEVEVELAPRQNENPQKSFHTVSPHDAGNDGSKTSPVSSKTALASFVAESSVHDAPNSLIGHTEPAAEAEATADNELDMEQHVHQDDQQSPTAQKDEGADDETQQLLDSGQHSNYGKGAARQHSEAADARPWFTRKAVLLTLGGYGMVKAPPDYNNNAISSVHLRPVAGMMPQSKWICEGKSHGRGET